MRNYYCLSWFYKDLISEKHKLHYIISGVARTVDFQRTVPDTALFDSKINRIMIHTVNRNEIIKAYLHTIITDLKKLCSNLEYRTKEFIERHDLNISDWTSRRDIQFILEPKDYYKNEEE